MMNRDTISDLLAIIAASDHRTLGEADIVLWRQVIGHLDEGDCTDAIVEFRRDQPGVWLEPGHVVARVRAKMRDRLDRADPVERSSMVTANGVRRDQFGAVDKAAPDEDDFPAEWTSEQRLSAYWDRVHAHRDQAEYRMATTRPGSLLMARPASGDTRAQVLAQFSKQYTLDPDDSVPQVDPHKVACPFCKVRAGSVCTVAGQDEKLRGIVAHPSRVELAAVRAGFPEDVVEEIVASAQRRQARLVQSGWSERDRGSVPVEGRVVVDGE